MDEEMREVEFELYEDQMEKLQYLAEERGITFDEIIVEAVKNFLDKLE